MLINKEDILKINLDDEHYILKEILPLEITEALIFDEIWDIHPTNYHEIMMHGKLVKTPRWQQAYERDYNYTGRVNKALSLPTSLVPLLDWVKTTIDCNINGVLINWYDGSLGHYIGKHRDSTINLFPNSPIVTISLGTERVFRLRPYNSASKKYIDIKVENGSCIIMPYETNKNYTHEIVKQKTVGNRISITFRAFGG
jgi:alkylated DNA repair dioxygenase AlkB